MIEIVNRPLFNNSFLATEIITAFKNLWCYKKERLTITIFFSSKAAKSLWFDGLVNDICVKFRFTRSGFWAPNGQNEFSRILTKAWAKHERNSNLELVPILVDIYRQSLLIKWEHKSSQNNKGWSDIIMQMHCTTSSTQFKNLFTWRWVTRLSI